MTTDTDTLAEVGQKFNREAERSGDETLAEIGRYYNLMSAGVSAESAADFAFGSTGQKADGDGTPQPDVDDDEATLEALVARLAEEYGVEPEAVLEALADLDDELPEAGERGQKADLDADRIASESVERATRELERRLRKAKIEEETNDVGNYSGGVTEDTDDLGNPDPPHRPLTDREADRILERDLDLDAVDTDDEPADGPGDVDPRIERVADSEGW